MLVIWHLDDVEKSGWSASIGTSGSIGWSGWNRTRGRSVHEVDQLDQVVAKLTKTAEYGYDVPVRISYGWTARKSREMHFVPQRVFCPCEEKKHLLNFWVWCKDCWCLRSVKCGLQENCASCNVANQFSDQICQREKHGIYHNQASSMNPIFRILFIFDKNQFDRGKALYKDKRVGVLEWWQWQARYILVMKWILYKYSASERGK